MKIYSVELFPTIVKKYTEILTSQQIDEIYEFCLRKQNLFTIHGLFNSDDALSSYGKEYSILSILEENLSSCRNIYEQFQEAIDDYANSIGFNELKINNSWINIQQKDSILSMHHHGNCFCAGAFYINTDSNSSPLFFEDYLNHKVNWNSNNKKIINMYNTNSLCFKPEVGDFVIFPGLLRHGSNGVKNQTDNRMVLSFNISLKSNL